MNKIHTKKGVWRMWIASYLVVLLFPIPLSIFSFVRSCEVIKQNALTLNQSQLSRTNDALEQLMDSISSLNRQLVTKSEVTSLVYASAPLSSIKVEKLGALQDDLRSIVSYESKIDDIYLLFNNSCAAASTKGYFNTQQKIDDQLLSAFGIRYRNILEWISSSGSYQVHTIGDVAQSAAQHILVLATASSYLHVPDVVCIYSLNNSALLKVLGNDANQSTLIWAYSPEGLLVGSSAALALGTQVSHETLSSDQSVSLRLEDSRYTLTTMHNSTSGWTLVSAVSTDQYEAQLTHVLRWYYIYLAVCFIVGIAFILTITARQYRPVMRLASLLHAPEGGNEYDAIEKSLQQILYKEKENASRLKLQRRKLQEITMERLLHGTLFSESTFETACHDYGLSFNGHTCLVLAVLLLDDGEFLAESAEEEDNESLLYFILSNVTEELVSPYATVAHCMSDGTIFSLITPKAEIHDLSFVRSQIQEACRNAQKWLMGRCSFEVTYFISDWQTSGTLLSNANAGYQQALWGLDQIETNALRCTVVDAESLSKYSAASPASGSSYRNQREGYLKAYLKAVQEGALDHANGLYRTLRFYGPVDVDHSLQGIKQQTAFIFDHVLKECMTEQQIQRLSDQLKADLAYIRAAKRTEELCVIMQNIAEQVSSLNADTSVTSEASLGARAVIYIQQHYCDPNLSVSSVADHFEVSTSYLLRAFKNNIQSSSVSEFIHQYRISQAKHLLKDSSLTIHQIAQQVGYNSSLTFIRAFKRIEGTTPTAYRGIITP